MKSQNVCTIDVRLDVVKKEAKVLGTDIYFGSDEWIFLMQHNGYFMLHWLENQISFGSTTIGIYAYHKGKKKYVKKFFSLITIDNLIEVAQELTQ